MGITDSTLNNGGIMDDFLAMLESLAIAAVAMIGSLSVTMLGVYLLLPLFGVKI